MTEPATLKKKPLIGFAPPFYGLGDTGSLVMIAKRYRELGGKAIFFSHGGEYEYLAKDNGFNIIQVNPILSDKEIEELRNARSVSHVIKFIRYKNFIRRYYSGKWIEESIKNEIEAFKRTGIKMIVSAFVPSCSISARFVKIPYVCVIPGASSYNIRAPDIFENFFTRLFPQSLKIRLINWYLPRTKLFLKPINKVAKKFHVSPFKSTIEIFYGDFTFVVDAVEFINIFPNQQRFPKKDYVGPVLRDELFVDKFSENKTKQIESEIESHLRRPGKSILLTLGSAGYEELFLRILKALNNTRYNIVAIYSHTLKKNELFRLNDNILLKKSVPSIEKVHRMVDLAIIHGGLGTVYTSAYAGKPTIGIPTQGEQHRNLEKLVGHGTGILLTKKYFQDKKLLAAIEEIFRNYDKYLTNAQNLTKQLPLPQGDKNAARRLIEIYTKIK